MPEGAVLPSACILGAVSWLYGSYGDTKRALATDGGQQGQQLALRQFLEVTCCFSQANVKGLQKKPQWRGSDREGCALGRGLTWTVLEQPSSTISTVWPGLRFTSSGRILNTGLPGLRLREASLLLVPRRAGRRVLCPKVLELSVLQYSQWMRRPLLVTLNW